MPNLHIFDGKVPRGEHGHGCLVPTPGDRTKLGLPMFDNALLLSDEEIDERSLAIRDNVLHYANSTPWIYQEYGSCCPCTYGHSSMYLDAEEGENVKLLAQSTLYGFDGLDRHGKPIPRRSDTGMSMAMGLLLARQIGMAPATVLGPTDWRQRSWPDETIWMPAAAKHTTREWAQTPSLRAIKSALVRPGVVAHGFDGHARCIIWWDPRERKFHCKNSWRSQPWHYLTERQVEQGEEQYEAFTPISTVARSTRPMMGT